MALNRCPNTTGVFAGIQVGSHTITAGPLRCNSWTCEFCQPIMKKRLFKRIYGGKISSECVSRYGLKFLTLTAPGQAWRDSVRSFVDYHNSDAAYLDQRNQKHYLQYSAAVYEYMTKAFHKLIRALKKRFGNFHYFRVAEPQKDGTPHFHVLLAGDAIQDKTILTAIKKLWCEKYQLGFVKINCVKFKGSKHAINYMLKYITKDIKKPGPYKRVFSASRQALEKPIKKDWRKMEIFFGLVDDRGFTEQKIEFEVVKHGPFNCVEIGGHVIEVDAIEDRMLDMLLNRCKRRTPK
jgi:hypothetical protein